MTFIPEFAFDLDCGVGHACVAVACGGEDDFLQPSLDRQSLAAIRKDLRFRHRLVDPAALNSDMVVRIAVPSAEDVDAALFLPVSTVFLSVWILQIVLEKDHASALEGLPILRLRNFLGGYPTEFRTRAGPTEVFSVGSI
ncbi:hypothetical protein [Afipia felis]